jgi:hypothetical protein
MEWLTTLLPLNPGESYPFIAFLTIRNIKNHGSPLPAELNPLTRLLL